MQGQGRGNKEGCGTADATLLISSAMRIEALASFLAVFLTSSTRLLSSNHGAGDGPVLIRTRWEWYQSKGWYMGCLWPCPCGEVATRFRVVGPGPDVCPRRGSESFERPGPMPSPRSRKSKLGGLPSKECTPGALPGHSRPARDAVKGCPNADEVAETTRFFTFCSQTTPETA